MHQVRTYPQWSDSLAVWLSPEYDDMRQPYPDGAALSILESSPEEPERALLDAWHAYVDRDFGRRLLFGRLRPDDIDRAERLSAEHARWR